MTEPSEILAADHYLLESWRLGYLDLKEAERRALIAGRLKDLYSANPWYAEQAKQDPDYWSKFSLDVGNRFAGQRYRGRIIPWAED